MMEVEENIEERPAAVVGGFAQRLWDFLKLLEDMEKKGETMRTVSGELEGPFNSKAAYGYTVKLGIEGNDFPLRRGFHPRQRPKSHICSIKSGSAEPELIAPDDFESQEPVVDVFDEGEGISIVAQIPYVREEDIDLKIVDKILKITANTLEGKIEKDIPVSDGSKIKAASFKNGILEIKLSKKK
ncbi:MAG: Hsp20/alpha crystallin family protein [Methanosarcinales archaeon]|nr:MAG: Hsp20/alpha crystallin family protein [Methanosarcinales archaeon]